jgi:hypothetical protein
LLLLLLLLLLLEPAAALALFLLLVQGLQLLLDALCLRRGDEHGGHDCLHGVLVGGEGDREETDE